MYLTNSQTLISSTDRTEVDTRRFRNTNKYIKISYFQFIKEQMNGTD